MRNLQRTLKNAQYMNAVGEWEGEIHDILHNIYVYVRMCILLYVYMYTYTYSYTSKQVNNTGEIHGDGKLETAKRSSTKSSSKYSFRIFSTEFFNLSVKKCYIMLMIHAPH